MLWICVLVMPGLACIISAAMAAPCGPAADVPKKGEKPVVLQVTPSAAVKSGLARDWPAVPAARLAKVGAPAPICVPVGLVAVGGV